MLSTVSKGDVGIYNFQLVIIPTHAYAAYVLQEQSETYDIALRVLPSAYDTTIVQC